MKVDYHVNSTASIDCSEPMEKSVRAAIAQGLDIICFTDHLDLIDGRMPGATLPDGYALWQRSYAQIAEVREKYGDKVEILHGMELAEIPQDLPRAKEYAAIEGIDYLLGATHILPNHQDFYYLQFTDQAMCETLADLYLDETYVLAQANLADTIAHIGYLNRYMARQGFRVDLMQQGREEKLRAIFQTLINNNRGIEVNTSGMRQEYGASFPNLPMLQLYRSLGGEIITIGSDAHSAGHVGSNFTRAAALLRTAGFTHFTIFRKRQPEFIKL